MSECAFQVVNNGYVEEYGMTLRDWFAGQASEDDIAIHREPIYEISKRFSLLDGKDVEQRAFKKFKYTREQAKYRYADSMMEARKK